MRRIIIFVLFITTGVSIANERDIKLDRLFDDLKNLNSKLTYETEQQIWKIWSTHPNKNNLTLMLSEGSNLVKNNQLYEAVQIFTKVIALDPKWAEAWNKRATVLYLLGEFQRSQDDIDKVLELEKRHFGALSGQGLVQTAMKNYQKAIDSYIEAHKVYPAMETPLMMIERLKDIIKKESI